MAKNRTPLPAVPAAPPVKRRGRPPGPDGTKTPAETQRAYRDRLRQAGKAYKVTDLTQPDLALFVEFRNRLHDAEGRLEWQTKEIARLTARNVQLEGDLRLQGQHHTNALKEIHVLEQEIAQLRAKPSRRRRAATPV